MSDGVLTVVSMGKERALAVATLSDESVVQGGGAHLGSDGYFLFETCDQPGREGVIVLGKLASFEAALRVSELLDNSDWA